MKKAKGVIRGKTAKRKLTLYAWRESEWDDVSISKEPPEVTTDEYWGDEITTPTLFNDMCVTGFRKAIGRTVRPGVKNALKLTVTVG